MNMILKSSANLKRRSSLKLCTRLNCGILKDQQSSIAEIVIYVEMCQLSETWKVCRGLAHFVSRCSVAAIQSTKCSTYFQQVMSPKSQGIRLTNYLSIIHKPIDSSIKRIIEIWVIMSKFK